VPGKQRQPTIAAGQHARYQIHQALPALIALLEHAIDRLAESIRSVMCQGSTRRLFVQRLGRFDQIQPGPRSGGDWELSGKPGIEGVDGFDAQARRMTLEVESQPVHVAFRRDAELRGR
jgi:hypothetical protein